jgi:two-component system chemotaxis response regulator CheB
MKSAAGSYGNGVIGMLLTGMGSDGAEGMQAIVQTGGFTIAQDESSSIVFGMPRQAIELGAATYVMPLEKIADALLQTLRTLSGVRPDSTRE